MPVEIERKFLVLGTPSCPSVGASLSGALVPDFRTFATEAVRISQAYLAGTPTMTVRARIWGDKGFLTIKGKSNEKGMSRFEWEKEITVAEAEALIALAGGQTIEKTRYLIPNSDGRHTWEVDVFYGPNEGLVLAEIELSSEDDTFDRPAWLGPEVTGDRRYYNSSLLTHPYKDF